MMDIIFTPRYQAEFWMKVKRVQENGCWEWQGKLRDGYGVAVLKDGKTAAAHRVAHTLLKGEIPEGLQIDHLCRNTKCVNPNHLEAVTLQENVIRGYAARPQASHCKRGHLLEGDSVYLYQGKRRCRVCRDEYLKNRYEEKKAGTHQPKSERLAYRLTSPDGEVFTVSNLTQFCREHGLTQGAMSHVIAGRHLTHKGWRGIRLE